MVILCIAGMAISIILRKDGKFPDGEISHNRELRSRGIECAKAEELRRWGRNKGRRIFTCDGHVSDKCASCAFNGGSAHHLTDDGAGDGAATTASNTGE